MKLADIKFTAEDAALTGAAVIGAGAAYHFGGLWAVALASACVVIGAIGLRRR